MEWNFTHLAITADYNSSSAENQTCQFEQKPLSGIHIFSTVIEVVFFLLIGFGNILVILAVIRSDALKTMTNYFIVQLAVADLLVSAIMPFHIMIFLHRPLLNTMYVCVLRYTTILFSQAISLVCLLAMTFDRFVVITFPLRYHAIMTTTRFAYISVLIWLSAFIFAFLIPSFWHNTLVNLPVCDCDFSIIMKQAYLQYIFLPFFIVYISLMVGIYGRLFQIAKKHIKGIQTQAGPTKRNFKTTKTCAIVMGTFIACWSPFCLIISIQVYGNQMNNKTLIFARQISGMIAILNSAMNPIIYAARMNTFQKEFKKILHLRPRQVKNVKRSATSRADNIFSTSTAMTSFRN